VRAVCAVDVRSVWCVAVVVSVYTCQIGRCRGSERRRGGGLGVGG